MNAFTQLWREVRRMLSERMTLLFIALTVMITVWFSLNSSGNTASDAFILEPAKSSAVFGALFFTLLTLVQFHRDYKNNTDSIVLTCTDPVIYQLRRTLALICSAIVTTLIVTVFTLPYGMAKTGHYFQIETLLASWYLIFLGALVFSVLLSSGIYMLTRSVGGTLITMLGLILISMLFKNMYALNPSYLFYWVQTTANNFSDLITNQIQIDMIFWNRLFCLLISMAIWTLGLCSLRRYGRGLPGSFLVNCRRVWVPTMLIVAVILSCISYTFEPIFDDSKEMDLSGAVSTGTGITVSYFGEQKVGNPDLILTDKSFVLDINAKGRTLTGVAKYKLKNATGKAQILPVMTNTGINIKSVRINNSQSRAARGKTGELSTANWNIELPWADEYEVEINYSGHMRNNNTRLQKAVYGIADGFVWFPVIGVSPSLDINISPDSTFSGILSLDESLEPILTKEKPFKGKTKDGRSEWQFTGSKGTQGTGLFAADYMTREFEAGELNIELKHFTKHEKSIENMDAVNVIKAAINYFTEAYGPLIYDKRLIMLELPAYASGGFAAGNMSAMDETSYNEEGYLSAKALTPDYGGGIDVLIHEIAHQWWGLATMPVQDGTPGWSAEALTCYSTYCFMKEYFGEEYAQEHFVKQWQKGWNTYKDAFYIQNPEYLSKLSDGDASSIISTFVNMSLYDIMPLMMIKGEEALGGTEPFQKKLSELYMTYLGKPITYDDFLNITGLTKEVIDLA